MGIHGKVLKQRGISHVLCAQHLQTFYMNCLDAFARAREAHWFSITGYTLYFLGLSPAITWCVSLCLRIITGTHRSPDIMIPLALVLGVTQIFSCLLMPWQYWEVLCKYLKEKSIRLGWSYVFVWFCLGWCMSVRKSFQVKSFSCIISRVCNINVTAMLLVWLKVTPKGCLPQKQITNHSLSQEDGEISSEKREYLHKLF